MLSARRVLRLCLIVAVTTVVLLPLAGCYTAEEEALDRGVAWAKAQLERVGRDPLAAMSFESSMEMGGGVLSYLYAAMPDDPSFPRIAADTPSEPWSVVIRAGEADGELVIEGYGEDLGAPVKVERVTLPAVLPVPR